MEKEDEVMNKIMVENDEENINILKKSNWWEVICTF